MSFRAYEFDPNTGKLTQILPPPSAPMPAPSPPASIEKVIFLSKSQGKFKVEWTGPQNMSGSASSMSTDLKINSQSYKSGWFAICREQVPGVQFAIKQGSKLATESVDFSGFPGWTPQQYAGLDGRVIVQKPGINIGNIDFTSLVIGIGVGAAVTALVLVTLYNYLQ